MEVDNHGRAQVSGKIGRGIRRSSDEFDLMTSDIFLSSKCEKLCYRTKYYACEKIARAIKKYRFDFYRNDTNGICKGRGNNGRSRFSELCFFVLGL